MKRSELDQLRLNYAERAGDVFVSARGAFRFPDVSCPAFRFLCRPRSAGTPGRGNKQTEDFLIAGGANDTGAGVHGHVSAHRQIQAIFFAYGPNVPVRLTGPVNAVDVAPTVASLLGIEPPRDTQGKIVFNPIR